jgi:hypothetical protein
VILMSAVPTRGPVGSDSCAERGLLVVAVVEFGEVPAIIVTVFAAIPGRD